MAPTKKKTSSKARASNNSNTNSGKTGGAKKVDATPMEYLLGYHLLSCNNNNNNNPNNWMKPQPTSKLLPQSQTPPLVAIYFASQTDPACRDFTPLLNRLYQAGVKLKKQQQQSNTKSNSPQKGGSSVLQVIYQGNETTFDDFQGALRQVDPAWLALPIDGKPAQQRKQALAKEFHVKELPALVIVCGATGQVISLTGVSQVRDAAAATATNDDKNTADSAYQTLLQTWLATEPQPAERVWDEIKRLEASETYTMRGFVVSLVRNTMVGFLLTLAMQYITQQLRKSS
mmetsp:Transcript_11653/g.32256  ORF Transcript_11653/g.32256 Transcript_11653/m.32256 type:complete len:287 (+) Transcript_11653:227-1087(+)